MSNLKSFSLCPKCHGTGNREGTIPDGQGGWQETEECPMCNSSGYIEKGKIEGKEEFNELKNILDEIKEELQDIKDLL